MKKMETVVTRPLLKGITSVFVAICCNFASYKFTLNDSLDGIYIYVIVNDT